MSRKLERHYRTTFVFLACFILMNGLFGEDVRKHKGLMVANASTRLLILSFIYVLPTA